MRGNVHVQMHGNIKVVITTLATRNATCIQTDTVSLALAVMVCPRGPGLELCLRTNAVRLALAVARWRGLLRDPVRRRTLGVRGADAVVVCASRLGFVFVAFARGVIGAVAV